MSHASAPTSVDFQHVSEEAYSEIVRALSKDMPLIMHGCGDVPIWDVNPQSAKLLAELTANYISNLVEAACDSQEILNGGERPPLPPPRLVSKEERRKATLPSAYEWPLSALPKPTKSTTTSKKKKKTITKESAPADSSSTAKDKDASVVKTTTSDKTLSDKNDSTSNKPPVTKPNFGEKKKRKRRDIEYWDDPLPEPKIRSKASKDAATLAAEKGEIVYEGVPIGDWVGVSGVDFFEDRIRSAHVTLPAAVGAQNFIFPVCHDKHLYGKILEIQATRRSMEPLLTDTVVMDVIRGETDLMGSLRKRREREEKRNKKDHQKPSAKVSAEDGATGNNAGAHSTGQETDDEEPEASDSEEDYAVGGRPVWPGLDELLPMHTTLDF